MYASAAIIATVYTFALVRLWRREYRRRDYRVAVALTATIALDGSPVAMARTADLSFGGASVTSPSPIAPGTEISLRLASEDPLTVPATVISCTEHPSRGHRLGLSFHPLPVQDEKRLLLMILHAATGTHPRLAHPQTGRDRLTPAPEPRTAIASANA